MKLRVLQLLIVAQALLLCVSCSTARGPGEPAISTPDAAVDTFDYLIGTQTFGARYQFTDEPRLLETAREIRKLGSNMIKFRLGPGFESHNYAGPSPGHYRDLRELASTQPTIRAVLDMPFAYYFFWVEPMHPVDWRDADGYTQRDAETEYREIYDLTRYLLQAYSGTGKRFYLGNWEGDWMLLGSFDRTQDPDPQRVKAMIAWQRNRQKAVDDARRDTPHTDVEVYHYLEVVLVEKGLRGRPCVATEVLPHVDVDYVSYSAYEMQTDHDLPGAMDRVLGFLGRQLQPKPGIAGRRVFIGEFGFQGNTEGAVMQRRRSLDFMRAAVGWGSPFTLQWQLYGNEDEGGQFRGYWLIDDKGRQWPLYDAFRQYYAAAHSWVNAARGGPAEASGAAAFAAAAGDILGGMRHEPAAVPVETLTDGFEGGTPAGWMISGSGARVVTDDPCTGRFHLRLQADGKPEAWAAASLVRPAGPGTQWRVEVDARRVKGALAKLKLCFYDPHHNMLRAHEVTSVQSTYQRLSLQAKAPAGTAEVHLVLAVEFGCKEDPAEADFDNAHLERLAEPSESPSDD